MKPTRVLLVFTIALVGAVLMQSCGGGGGGGGTTTGGGGGGGGDTTAPAMVTGLSISVVSSGQINLSWNASSDNVGVTGYKIYRGVGGGSVVYHKSVAEMITSDTGLNASTQYCYKVSACDAAGNESTPCVQQCATTQAGLAFGGFNFGLATGDFWEYRWNYYDDSWAMSDHTITTDSGRYWVVLGAPATIQGKAAYAVTLYGKGQHPDGTFVPRWKYLAMVNNQMLGSTDGTTLTTIFDAQTGKWPGGGFFTTLPGTKLTLAQIGTISTYNTYISGTAIVAGRSSSQSMCEYYSGIGTICGDSSYDRTENEYYRPSLGPAGYYYFYATSYSGGGFWSGNTWRHNVGLTASSFTGEPNPLISESEANDSSATADPITTANPVVGTVTQSTLANAGNTVITVTVTDDGGTTGTVSPTVEDWYSFTLASARTVTITLSFEGSTTADLDVYLLGSNGTTLYGYSIHDNPARQNQNERITKNLSAGSYRIGVDGYLTPAGAVTYTLQLE
jgi:hypothetical protein